METAVPVIDPHHGNELTLEHDRFLSKDGKSYPKKNGAYRFVTGDNYTESFGFQWNQFVTTQIDDANSEVHFSRERLLTTTGWDREDLTGKVILEVGSGAGRFSKVILEETNPALYSVDYSDAVSANFQNNGHFGNRLQLFQASIYELPFPDNSFDKVLCFGVLQHTPDFRQSVKCLIDKLKPGGELVIDFYPVTSILTKLHAKYLFRPFTKRMDHKRLLQLIDKNADRLIKAYRFFDKLGVGKIVNRFLPVCDIKNTLPENLTEKELREWVVLDTFDMYSPQHDHPQRISTVKKWCEEFGLNVQFAGFMTYAADKKVAIVKGIKK